MSSAWSQLEQLLTCAICLDRYRNPKLLPCQHTFCTDPCLEGLIDYGRRQIKCPECRAEHRIPYQGVQTYPTNVTLVRFLELHRDVTGEEPEPPLSMMERCTICSEKAYVVKCAHCDKKICDECREAHTDILRREIGRINNQVRRGLQRLSECLVTTQNNTEKLKQNCNKVKDEIEELVRRCTKDLKDSEDKLLLELDEYLQSESCQMKQLKSHLDVEVENFNSNCELVDKYVSEDMEWTDVELVQYKEILLKTLEFIRNFESDPSDFSRRVRFHTRTDSDVLHRMLIDLGELNISSLIAKPSVTISTPPSNALMRSQSDHRLASQFQRRQEGRTQLDLNRMLGSHTSELERESSSTGFARNWREVGEGNSYKRFGERRDNDISDRERGRSRFLKDENGALTYRNWRDVDADTSFYRSRFTRDHSDESQEQEVNIGRSVRFEEPPEKQENLFKTSDATKGPLSGVVKLIDSPYFMERLHQNEVRQKQQQLEKEQQEKEQSNPIPPTSVPVLPRQHMNRQLSEDEIEKQKKQNKAAVAATVSSNASTPEVSPLPTPNTDSSNRPLTRRVSALQKSDDSTAKRKSLDLSQNTQKSVESPGASSSSSPVSSPPPTPTNLESSARPLTRRVSELQKLYESTAKTKTPESSKRTYKSGTSSSDGSTESRISSRRSSQQDDVPDTSVLRLAKKHEGNSSNEPEPEKTSAARTSEVSHSIREDDRPKSRFIRSSLGKTQSAEADGKQGSPPVTSPTSRRNDSSLGRNSSQVKESDEKKTPVQSSFYGRLLGQQAASKTPVEEEESETESESEVSSTETESEEPEEPKNLNISVNSPAVTTTLSRRAQNSRQSTDLSGKDAYPSTGSRPSHYDTAREETKNRSATRSSLIRDEEPHYPSRHDSSIRRAPLEDDTKDSTSAYKRYLARSRSSAGLGRLSTNLDDRPEDLYRGASDRYRYDTSVGSNLRRTRVSRSKSSADILAGEESPDDDLTSHRRRKSYTFKSSRDDSPDDSAPTGSRSWAQYIRDKYGSRSSTGLGSSGLRTRTSRGLYSKSDSDDSSDDESPKGRSSESPSSRRSRSQSYSFNYPRISYMHKRKCIMKLGVRGSEPSCFTWPRGVCVGPDNTIVVADSSNHRVQVFDSSGKFLQKFGTYGSAEGEFDCLAGIAVNRIGQFIVSDRYNHRIQIFDSSGKFLRVFGSEGRLDGRFNYPWGITTDSLGFIYVCDKENHRIQVFQSDGTFVGKFGTFGTRPGHLEHPHYIAVSNTNRVVVSDTNNHRIQIFDVNGRSLSTIGNEGSEEGQFKFPRGVAVDDQGYIIVGDSGNNRIQIFHPDGTFLRTFGSWGAGDGEFKGLEGIAVTSNGCILVCDRENHRIQMF